MKPELEEKLFSDFPKLYRLRGDRSQFAGAFYCGDGWEPLIRRLSEKLEPMLDFYEDNGDMPACVQVKEKFGGLCFYINGGNDEIWALIQEAEEEAWRTCEICGSTDDAKANAVGGWIRTNCPPCHEAEEVAMKARRNAVAK